MWIFKWSDEIFSYYNIDTEVLQCYQKQKLLFWAFVAFM